MESGINEEGLKKKAVSFKFEVTMIYYSDIENKIDKLRELDSLVVLSIVKN